jgi:hypothetical protein
MQNASFLNLRRFFAVIASVEKSLDGGPRRSAP